MINLKTSLKTFAVVVAMQAIGIFAWGATLQNFEQAKKTWDQFRACNQVKGEAAIDKCLNATLLPTIDPLAKQKMTEYILMSFKFTDIKECDERDTVLPVKAKTPVIHYCLHVLGNRTRTQGYATFELYKKELRLTSIRYDF